MKADETAVHATPDLDGDAMIAAMTLGVAEALRAHRSQGVPVITWDENTQQVLIIPANQIPDWIDEVRPTA